MSAFPPDQWDIPINVDLITSNDPLDQLRNQEELVRRIKDISGQLSTAIYGQSSKFLPVARGSSTAGSGTYAVQAGYYVRFGRMVWFTLNIQFNDADHTGTGNLEITGLPATHLNETNIKSICTCYCQESGAEFVGVAIIEPGDNYISVIKNGATTVQINGSDHDYLITGIYRAI